MTQKFKMYIILFLVQVAFSINILTKPSLTFAVPAGEYCCGRGRIYDPGTNTCVLESTRNAGTAISCDQGLRCIRDPAHTSDDPYGVNEKYKLYLCAETPDDPANWCCDYNAGYEAYQISVQNWRCRNGAIQTETRCPGKLCAAPADNVQVNGKLAYVCTDQTPTPAEPCCPVGYTLNVPGATTCTKLSGEGPNTRQTTCADSGLACVFNNIAGNQTTDPKDYQCRVIYATEGSPCCVGNTYWEGGECLDNSCKGKDEPCKIKEKDECSKSGLYCDIIGKQPEDWFCSKNPPVQAVSTTCSDNPLDVGIDTAIGCIRTSPGGFIQQFLAFSIGLGSGIAFLSLIWGSFKIITSQGNPEGINAGKEILTSAIIGLLFVILSVTVMQVIGFDILGLGALGLGQ